MEKEIWKDIKGYEGIYQVSSFGNIRSLDRIVAYRNNTTRQFKGTQLKAIPHSNGYIYVNLNNNRDMKHLSVHRIVALHFIDNPQNKPQVNHKDGNKTNNHIDNLEWMTCGENHKHAYRHLNKTPPAPMRGQYNYPKFSKPVIQMDEDGGIIREYPSIMEASRQLKISDSHIASCCKGSRLSVGRYKWAYLNPNA